MNRQVEYRAARDAQRARYEDATGLPFGEVGRQEYRDYFGIGDCAGTPVETLITYKSWLVDGAAERPPVDVITPAQAFLLTGADLASLAAAGDYEAAAEIVRRKIRKAQKRGQVAA